MEQETKKKNPQQTEKTESLSKEYPPKYSRRDIQEKGVRLEDYIRVYEDPWRGRQEYLPYRFRLAWLRNVYPDGVIRQLEPQMLADGRQLIGGMEFFRNPEDVIGERVYCQVSRDETGPELDTRDLFEVLRQKLINAITIGLGFSLPVPSAQEAADLLQDADQDPETVLSPESRIRSLEEELDSLRMQVRFLKDVKHQNEETLEKQKQTIEKQQAQLEQYQQTGPAENAEAESLPQQETEEQTPAEPRTADARNDYRPDQVSFTRKTRDGGMVWVNREGGRITTPVLKDAKEAWDLPVQVSKGESVPLKQYLSSLTAPEQLQAFLMSSLDRSRGQISQTQFPAVCAIRYLQLMGELDPWLAAAGLEFQNTAEAKQ